MTQITEGEIHDQRDRFLAERPVWPFPCMTCRRRLSATTCEAFAKKIPDQILSGQHQHREKFEGDHGLQYEEGNPKWKPKLTAYKAKDAKK